MDHIPGGGSNDSELKRLQLKLAVRAAAAQKKAVWEVTKQYTWWLLTIVVALMVLATRDFVSFRTRAIGVLVGLVVELVLSLIALSVLRRECSALGEQLRLYDRVAKESGFDAPALDAGGGANKGLGALVGGLFASAKMRTWDWFQATFVLVAGLSLAGFVALLVIAIIR